MESARHVHHAPAFSRRLAEFCVECRSAANITERQFTAKAANLKRPKPPLFTHLSPATSWGLGHAQGLPGTYFRAYYDQSLSFPAASPAWTRRIDSGPISGPH